MSLNRQVQIIFQVPVTARKIKIGMEWFTTWLRYPFQEFLRYKEQPHLIPTPLLHFFNNYFSLCLLKPAAHQEISSVRGQDWSKASIVHIPGRFFLQFEYWYDFELHVPLPCQKPPPVPLGSISRKYNLVKGKVKWYSYLEKLSGSTSKRKPGD